MRFNRLRPEISIRKDAKSRNRLRRARTLELLEGRVMLAADTGVASPWHNSLNALDVNHDAMVSPLDALMIVNDLLAHGAHVVPAQSVSPLAATSASSANVPSLDVNGDNLVSPLDLVNVVNALATTPQIDIHTFATDLAGNPISTVAVGSDFRIETDVQDIRNPAATFQGVFSAYLNVSYDSSIALIAPGTNVSFDPFFAVAHTSDLSTPGLISQTGASSGSLTAPGNGVQKLWSVVIHANAAGLETLTPTFDAAAGHDVSLYGSDVAVSPDAIQFRGGQVQVVQTPVISIGNVSHNEGNSGTTPFVFTVSLSTASATQVTVAYNTADVTATAPSDYIAQSGTLTFAPNATTQFITVLVNGDTTVEPDEVFDVVLSSPSANAALGTSTGIGTIVNDDFMPSITVGDVTKQNVATGTTTAVFTVSLSVAASSPVTVQFATADDTALAGTDYVAQSGTLTFNPGVLTQTVTVTIIGNPNNAPTKDFFLNLTNPTNSTIGDNQAIGTILPAVVLPTLSINNVALPEGNSGLTDFVFTASLSNPANQTVLVGYTTADGTATVADNDYQAQSGTLTFAPGVTSQTITIEVVGDTKVEPTETFSVNLTAGSGVANPSLTATGTIINDDGIAVVDINSVSIIASPTDTVNAVFTVTLSTAVTQQVTVGYATADNTALSSNGDYIPQSGNLTFVPGGPVSQTITVPVGPHPVPIDDTSFFVNLSSLTGNATIGASRGVGTIIAQGVSITSPTVVQPSSGTTNAVFTVSLSKPQTHVVTVQFNTADGTATVADNDYQPQSGTLTFSPGVTSQTITVAVNGDPTVEANETFFVNLSNAVGTVLFQSQGTCTILNANGQKALVELQLAKPDGTLLPPNSVLNPNSPFVLQVIVQDIQGNPSGIAAAYLDALYDSHLVQVTGPIVYGPNFPNVQSGSTSTPGLIDEAGAFSQLSPPAQPGAPELLLSIPFKAIDVGLVTFTPNPADVAGHDILEYTSNTPIPPSAVNYVGTSINIGSNVFAINSVTQNEGNSGITNFVFTVTRFLPTNSPATVVYSTSDGTATAGQDYAAQSGTLTFNVGDTTKTVTVAVNGNLNDEPDETFFVNLSNPVGAVSSQSPGVGTILNDDGPPAASIADASAPEGSDLTFVVSLAIASGKTVTIPYSTADSASGNKATAGLDYQPVSGTLTFAPGQTQQIIAVHALTDILVEPTETFQVVLGTPVNATLARGQAQGSIIDVPPAILSGFVYVDTNNDGVKENNEIGIGGVTITATSVSNGSSQTTLTNADGSYSFIGLQPGTYTIKETQPAFYIDGRDTHNGVDSPLNDQFAGITLVSSQLASGYNFGELGLRPEFVGSVMDRRAFFSSSIITGEIGPPNTAFNLAQGDVWVSFDSGWQGTRTIDALFQTSQGTATMTLYDSNVNPLTSSTPVSNGAVLPYTGATSSALFLKVSGSNSSVSMKIDDSVSVGNVKQTENNTGTTNFVFTVSLSAAQSQPVTVQFFTSDGTGKAGTDYIAKSGMLTFAPGVTSQTVTVVVNGDTAYEPDETFYLNLSSPAGVQLGQSKGVGTIVSNYASPTPSRVGMFATATVATDSAMATDQDWVTDSVVS